MKLKINSALDLEACEEIAGLQNVPLVQLLGAYAEQCDDDILEIVINKELLADSYRGNPSLLAARVLARLSNANGGEWESCSGHLAPAPAHVTVRLSKQPKTRHVRLSARPSVKQTIKDWLNLNEPCHKKLRLPTVTIPPWYQSHPEQLAYTIKQETQITIKITKLTASYLISRK